MVEILHWQLLILITIKLRINNVLLSVEVDIIKAIFTLFIARNSSVEKPQTISGGSSATMSFYDEHFPADNLLLDKKLLDFVLFVSHKMNRFQLSSFHLKDIKFIFLLFFFTLAKARYLIIFSTHETFSIIWYTRISNVSRFWCVFDETSGFPYHIKNKGHKATPYFKFEV